MFPGVALVTGAASGIGQATAVSFARESCSQIVIADRNVNGLNETHSRVQEAAPNCSVLSVQTDVSDQESVQALINKAVETFGRLDYVCNSAGTLSNNERSHETSLEEFDRINNINYKGCWLCSRAEIQQILKQEPLPTHDGRPGNRGSVVNIASQLGIVGRPAARTYPSISSLTLLAKELKLTFSAAYCGSKAAVISMTRCDVRLQSYDSSGTILTTQNCIANRGVFLLGD
ncbi:hypothetical protein D0869_16211 [Hortaea werneckii]|uniref:Uncharacterized protein n=1 Tax=Hortaea werneckii TaxID=91943 RepID=A0A3M6VX75_HORWE|nr:hypothetical protein D0869_16211 [Hortaea werneckii]